MAIQLYSLADLRDRYAAALAWLRKMGVRVDQGRLPNYLRALNEAIEAEAKDDTAHQGSAAFVNAIVEVSDIIDIAELDPTLFEHPEARRKLGFVANGPDAPDESGDDQGRDYAFEFSAAAQLAREGALGGFADKSGDLLFSDGHIVECKRITSLKKIEERLRTGRKQLEGSISAGGKPGLIALDLTTPIRAKHGIIAAKNEDGVADGAEEQARAYIADHIIKPIIFEGVARPYVLGVAVRFVAVGTAGKIGNIRRSVVWSALELHDTKSPEGKLFLALADEFGKGALVNITHEEIEAARSAIDTSIPKKSTS